MAATEALQRLKHGADAILKNALEQRDRPSSDLAVAAQAQAAQDRLAEEVLAAAKDMDSIFERAKLACTEESEDDVKAEIEQLEATIQDKDALLQKSLQKVSAWEAKFAQLRSAQEPLLFNE